MEQRWAASELSRTLFKVFSAMVTLSNDQYAGQWLLTGLAEVLVKDDATKIADVQMWTRFVLVLEIDRRSRQEELEYQLSGSKLKTYCSKTTSYDMQEERHVVIGVRTPITGN